MFGLPKEIAGTIAAAVIAAGISLIGLIISKENKVSEFRQAWIDSLRAEIAAVITHAHALHGAYLAKFPDNPALWQHVREDFVELNEAWAKIKLRLNPKEEYSLAVIRALGEHEDLFSDDGTRPDFSKLKLADRNLLESTQVVLKEEWRRVKRGEFFYRTATVLAGLMVIAGLLLLFKSSMLSAVDPSTERYVIAGHTVVPANDSEAPVDEYVVRYSGETLTVRYSESQSSTAKPGDSPGTGLHPHSRHSNPDLSQVPPAGVPIRACLMDDENRDKDGHPLIAKQPTAEPCMARDGDTLLYKPAPNGPILFTFVAFDILSESVLLGPQCAESGGSVR